jgi:hypothetical protein
MFKIKKKQGDGYSPEINYCIRHNWRSQDQAIRAFRVMFQQTLTLNYASEFHCFFAHLTDLESYLPDSQICKANHITSPPDRTITFLAFRSKKKVLQKKYKA